MERRTLAVDARRVGEIQHGIASGAELHALVFGGQKAAAPQAVVERLIDAPAGAARDHHHERRQILALAAQAVRYPRAEARPARHLAAGLNERDRRDRD